jgi:hypothetical protein
MEGEDSSTDEIVQVPASGDDLGGSDPSVRQSNRKRRQPSQQNELRRSIRRRTNPPHFDQEGVSDDNNADAEEEESEAEASDDIAVDFEMEDVVQNGDEDHSVSDVVAPGLFPANGTSAATGANGSFPTTMGASALGTTRLDPLSKLRMPSQHTPGNKKDTKVSSRPIAMPSGPDFSRRLIFQRAPEIQPAVTNPRTASIPLEESTFEEDAGYEEELILNGSQHSGKGSGGGDDAPDRRIAQLTNKVLAIGHHLGGYIASLSTREKSVSGIKYFGGPRGPFAWVLVFLVIQGICVPPSRFPGWKSGGSPSKNALIFYKSLVQTPSPEPVMLKQLAQVVPDEGNDGGAEVVERATPKAILDALTGLERLKDLLSSSLSTIRMEADGLSSAAAIMGKVMATRLGDLLNLDSRLSRAEDTLSRALDYEDTSSDPWQAARAASFDIGRTLLDGVSLDLWHVDQPVHCTETHELEAPKSSAHLVHPDQILEHVRDLQHQARMTAENLISSPESAEKVREWVKAQIHKTISGDTDAARSLHQLSSSSPVGMNFQKVDEVIQKRLEIDLADKTGQVDHASLLNGATVILGGKRGTTRSLVDTLPVLNRLMQMAALRFYGYGPEAALTPTYPTYGLGQCWAFVQTPLSDQIKRRRFATDLDDDHKRGNFGTLTVSLPSPVLVKSVIIEHPPKGLTDQITSAIRSFRIIGYTDSMAVGKSWSLGSFEFDIRKNLNMLRCVFLEDFIRLTLCFPDFTDNESPLQEFMVATNIFGTQVPRLHAITLAVDSNWGFDYACLYRLRVHGEKYTSRY